MKKATILLLLGLALAMSGCIPSAVHQFYTEDDLVFDPNILGAWGEDGVETTFFEQADSLTYLISLEDESGRASFEGHLFKLNGVLLLDLTPDFDELQMNETYKQFLLPVHSLYRVEQTEPDFAINMLDYQWLTQELKKQPAPLEFFEVEGRAFITSPTEQMQAFLLTALDNPDAFTHDPMVLHRIKR